MKLSLVVQRNVVCAYFHSFKVPVVIF